MLLKLFEDEEEIAFVDLDRQCNQPAVTIYCFVKKLSL
jgi:hypothetical protein